MNSRGVTLLRLNLTNPVYLFPVLNCVTSSSARFQCSQVVAVICCLARVHSIDYNGLHGYSDPLPGFGYPLAYDAPIAHHQAPLYQAPVYQAPVQHTDYHVSTQGQPEQVPRSNN